MREGNSEKWKSTISYFTYNIEECSILRKGDFKLLGGLKLEKQEWYLEYEIQANRPGLLGDISSLLGMMSINIVTINGVDEDRRGLLILAKDDKQIERLESILQTMDTIKLIKLRKPQLRDRLAVSDMEDTYKEMQMIKKHFVLFEMNWEY